MENAAPGCDSMLRVEMESENDTRRVELRCRFEERVRVDVFDVSAEVFPGWTSVGFQAPGVLRLPGARSNWKTIANVVHQRLRFEVRVAHAFFIVSGFFFVDGPPWKTSTEGGGFGLGSDRRFLCYAGRTS